MTTLAGRKIRRYRESRSPKLSRGALGERFGVSFSTVQGWEEDGKVPRAPTLAAVVASGIVAYVDWYTPGECPRCERSLDSATPPACARAHCPLAAIEAA